MKIVADTNLLIRAVVRDDEKQGRAAAKILKDAETIAVPVPCLCEFVWVLRRVYRFEQEEIAAALEALLNTGNVVVDRAAADGGLAVLTAGGDFAEGVIGHEGRRLGGEIFVSFDRRAASLLSRQGYKVKLLT